jgi:TolA-binding protein
MKQGCFTAILIGLSVATAGAEPEKPTYHERLEYDAAKGKWIEIAPPVPGTEEGDLALARSLSAQCEYKKARKAFDQWFKTYPESTRRPEALFYAAENEVSAEDAKPKDGDLMKAHQWLEEVLDGWAGTGADRSLRKELIIAEMVLFRGHKQKVWKIFWLSADEDALTILDRIIDTRARETPIAEQALRLKADYHYTHGNFQEAETAYARLMREFPRGRYQKFAMLRAGESARTVLAWSSTMPTFWRPRSI